MNNCNTSYRNKNWLGNRLVFFLFVLFILGISLGCREATLIKKESFHPNGNVWEVWHEDNTGFRQGKVLTYYENGQLQTEAVFENGYLNGEFVMWSKEGAELCRGTYKEGEPWTGTFVSIADSQQRVAFNKFENGKLIE